MQELEALFERALADALEDPPCGPNLEYEPAFLELEAAAQPAAEPEFDDPAVRPAAADWQWVERRALTLLERSKDVRLAVLAARAWARLRGIEGLAAGLWLVLRLLERHWDCAHPQLDAEDGDDPTMRLNALAALTHHAGLLADLRASAIAWEAFEPITVRDLELAFTPGGARPGRAGRWAPDQILRLAREAERRTPRLGDAASAAGRGCHELQRLLIERVGAERAPDLAPLARLIETLRYAFPLLLSSGEAWRAPAEEAGAEPAATAGGKGLGLEDLLGVEGRAGKPSDAAGDPFSPPPTSPEGQRPDAGADPFADPFAAPLPAAPPAAPSAGADPFAEFAPAAPAAPDISITRSAREPVRLGVSAPRAAAAGEAFSARFVAYVDSLEGRVKRLLADLDGERAKPVLGLAPERMAAWRIGTPVTVRVSGERFAAAPAERGFEWSGAQNLLSFSVNVAPDAPPGPAQLLFEAFIEAVPIASIPLTIEVGAAASAGAQTASAAAPRTAFASYASADGALVAMCLSALARWDPGLEVFMDCLDLTPNEDWQKELERVIGEADAFMLFWSKHAMASRWVQWEWHRANALGRPGFIRPFPLDDPAIAPPPPELAHLHFRDRYLMARQAMLRLADAVRARQADA